MRGRAWTKASWLVVLHPEKVFIKPTDHSHSSERNFGILGDVHSCWAFMYTIVKKAGNWKVVAHLCGVVVMVKLDAPCEWGLTANNPG